MVRLAPAMHGGPGEGPFEAPFVPQGKQGKQAPPLQRRDRFLMKGSRFGRGRGFGFLGFFGLRNRGVLELGRVGRRSR
jgi:hypothetical protein